MSYSLDTLVACPVLQDNLFKAFKSTDYSNIIVGSPLTEYLNSPVNKGTLQQSVAGDDGKVRTIRLTYRQRVTGAGATYNAQHPKCTATGFRTNNYVDYTIDPTSNIHSERAFDLNDLIYSCENNADYMATTIMDMVNEIDQAAFPVFAAQAYALAGKYGTDVEGTTGNFLDQLVVKTKIDGTINPYPDTFQEIEIANMQSGYSMPYTIFGGTSLWKYASRVEQGCCADNGLDIGGLYNKFKKAVAYDHYVAAAMGGNDYNLTVGNGALQLITYNLFKGPNGLNTLNISPTYVRMVIKSPNTGLPMDLNITDNCGAISINLNLMAKVVGLPADMFRGDDIYRGVKFVNRIKVTNV